MLPNSSRESVLGGEGGKFKGGAVGIEDWKIYRIIGRFVLCVIISKDIKELGIER